MCISRLRNEHTWKCWSLLVLNLLFLRRVYFLSLCLSRRLDLFFWLSFLFWLYKHLSIQIEFLLVFERDLDVFDFVLYNRFDLHVDLVFAQLCNFLHDISSHGYFDVKWSLFRCCSLLSSLLYQKIRYSAAIINFVQIDYLRGWLYHLLSGSYRWILHRYRLSCIL